MHAARERSADSKSRSHHAIAERTVARSAEPGGLAGVGNRALLSLLRQGRIQTKTRVTKPDDPREVEAERVADSVLRMEEPSSEAASQDGEEIAAAREPSASPASAPIMRACASCEEEEEEEETVQRAAEGPLESASTSLGEVLRSPGQPLDTATRDYFEPRFQRSLEGVRVHTDSEASASAKSIRAHAYTHGRDIVFGPGQYAPHTSAGRRLLAHELAHVVQNGHAASDTIMPYRDRTEPAFDREKRGEREFKNREKQPWIELIAIHFSGSKPDPEEPGYLIQTGHLKATYYKQKRPPISVNIVGGSTGTGLTDATAGALVHRIKGYGYNHKPLPPSKRWKGQSYYHIDPDDASMSYAVYINSRAPKQAVHSGSARRASLSCVHVPNDDKMRELNFHSVVKQTKVVVTYDAAVLKTLCCSRIKYLVQVEGKRVRKRGDAPPPCANQDPKRCP